MRHEVLDANEAFYRSIRAGDVLGMDTLWAAHRPVSCQHPGWATLTGRTAVMESWQLILADQQPPDIWPINPDAVVTGKSAIVICIERLGPIELMACNGFYREAGVWRITDHQASRVPAQQAR